MTRRAAVVLTHLHVCGHYDGCYLMAPTAATEPCQKCKRAATNQRLREAYEARLSTEELLERRA